MTPEDADEAFDQLYRSNYRRLLAKAMVVTGNRLAPAQDAVQDTFEECWKRLTSEKPPVQNWNAWLAKVVVREALAVAQAGDARREPMERWDEVDVGADPAFSFDLKEAFRRVCNEARRLAPQRRRALVLRCFGGFSTREVAEMMGISEPAVRSHVTFARRDLDWVWQDLRAMGVVEGPGGRET
ncbi:sigma-70 family RNA polymerase sigma factor [Kitasatospora sp. NPDC085895]|uniref:RNA polymerase sigma factor n=1 Tax=Kitasatospora sp. NPDC085895 TaxID=3155057 RepID=UPI0034510BDE